MPTGRSATKETLAARLCRFYQAKRLKEPQGRKKESARSWSGLLCAGGILDEYNEGYLRFSCPANWINYAKIQPPGIADKFEAVFAHVKRDPVYRPDLYHDNELIVPVPGLKSYSSIIPATKCSTIMFDNFNEDFSRYDICFGDGGRR